MQSHSRPPVYRPVSHSFCILDLAGSIGEVTAMLGEIVGFLAKLAVWAFLAGLALGIYLGLRYAPESTAVGCAIFCSGFVRRRGRLPGDRP